MKKSGVTNQQILDELLKLREDVRQFRSELEMLGARQTILENSKTEPAPPPTPEPERIPRIQAVAGGDEQVRANSQGMAVQSSAGGSNAILTQIRPGGAGRATLEPVSKVT